MLRAAGTALRGPGRDASDFSCDMWLGGIGRPSTSSARRIATPSKIHAASVLVSCHISMTLAEQDIIKMHLIRRVIRERTHSSKENGNVQATATSEWRSV